MTFISLFSDKHGFAATDQRVFKAEELQPLLQITDLVSQLTERLAAQRTIEEKACSDAMQQGHAKGIENGQAEARLQFAESLKVLHDNQRIALQEMQDNCAELAVEIVRKIAGQVKSDEWLLAQARQAALTLIDQPTVKLRVHSGQAEAIKARLDNLEISSREIIDQVIGDDAVPEDACILETGHGQVQVDLDTQLSSVLALFTTDESQARAHD